MRVKFLTLTFLAASAGVHIASAASETDAAAKANAVGQYVQLPMSFEMNEGQSDPQVKALAHGSHYGLFLTSSESVFVLTSGQKDQASGKRDQAVVRVRTLGSNPNPKVSGLDRMQGASNYYIGNDPSKWRKGVANYARLKYDSVYPGIDLIYYGNQQQLEYDYVVAPGADPGSIRLAIEGARKLRIDSKGDLLLETARGAIYQHKPVIYQQIDGVRREIAGSFKLHGNRVSFNVGDYDRSKELVVDPSLVFFTYLGGSAVDEGKAIAVAFFTGVTVVAGLTTSTNFPLDNPLYPTFEGSEDGFVTAFASAGNSLIDSTYVGGTGGTTSVAGLALDTSLEPQFLYVAGNTTSTTLPLVNPHQSTYGGGSSDGWVAQIKLTVTSINPVMFTTAIGFSTYLGGSGTDGITGVAMDQISKDGFVTGYTSSTNFPVTSGVLQTTLKSAENGFVTRYAQATGIPSFSTYFGGAGIVQPNAIATYTNLTNSVITEYVAGVETASSTAKEAFLAALNETGTAYGFFKSIGSTTTVTAATSVTTDSDGGIYITGYTDDPSLPTVSPVQATYGGGGNDAFVGAYNSSGTATFFTYWGGSGYDEAQSVGVFLTNNSDLTTSINLFIAGYTTGSFPTQSAVQSTYGGGSTDGFVSLFSTSHNSPFAKGYSTYLGGTGTDIIYGLFVGSSGNARVTGLTNSPSLATTGAYQTAIAGSYDAFVAEIQTTP